MPLFQATVVKKYLAELDKEKLSSAWQNFSAHFHNPYIQANIRAAKEEQYQEGFLRELFVSVLGYTLNPQPDFNLTTEYKNEKDSKKADGAILIDGAIRAVIELKGTDTTDLAKVEKQAFSYLNNHKGCTYVVTSNFEKLRFYIQDAIEFEEFNLFTLTQNEFSMLYLCLHKNNIVSNLPLTIKKQSVSQEDNVTKRLYADYSRFRNAIFQNLVRLNPQYDKLELFKKTQKLLDRFLFILFAEDRLLLPPNFIIKITEDWKQLQKLRMPQPLYSRFQLYFADLLHGNAAEDIFAYNGGLFQPDEVLDALLIDDTLLLEGVLALSKYDYNSEVDVNILGHIFEHSLNEIENLQASIDATNVDKTKTRRKKEGVFYTPRYITKYIVENTIGTLCIEKKAELQIVEEDYAPITNKSDKKTSFQRLEDYRAWLLALTICDPACGSGAFLNAALEFLIAEHHLIDELTNKLTGSSLQFQWTPNDILENNLFGVDINEEAVEIARLSLWLRTAQKGRKLSNLSSNIKVGNSLIDDVSVAGNKAFDWKSEFKDVFNIGGFHIILGNPPYVFSRGKITQSDKIYFIENFISAQYQINTYLLFVEKSIRLLRTSGHLGLIIPNAWLMVGSASNLRKYILENIALTEIVNLSGYSFESVNVETIILLGKKAFVAGNILVVRENKGTDFLVSNTKIQSDLNNNPEYSFTVFADSVSENLSLKLKSDFESLEEIATVKAGLQAYEVGKGSPIQTQEDVLSRPYDFNYKLDENTFKYLEGKDVNRYYHNWTGSWLQYGAHLAAPRTFDIFSGNKIIIREITGKYPNCIIGSYSEDIFLFNRSNIAIVENTTSTYSLKYILALLNSSLLSYYFMKNTPKSVRLMFPKIILQDLKKFPIKKASVEKQQPFIEKTEILLLQNEKLQKVKTDLIHFLQSKYSSLNNSKKISNWPSISGPELLKELDKCKIRLSLSEQNEWLQYFEKEKTKALDLQEILKKTDKEIDQMVYALYNLTEEEIAIVEAG